MLFFSNLNMNIFITGKLMWIGKIHQYISPFILLEI
jgi:hypothetical protein